MRRLTDSIIEGLKTPAKGYRIVYDTTPGLGVRVSETGARSFIFDYSAGRTAADIKAGRYPRRRVTLSAQTLADARAEASDLRVRILETKHDGAQRFDPIEARKQEREQAEQALARTQIERQLEARTLGALADQWLAKHAEQHKRPASLANDRSLLGRYIRPTLGARKVAELSHAEVENLLAAIAETPVMANRCHALLKTILNYGIRHGWLGSNPANGIARHREHPRNVERSDAELARLHQALDQHPSQSSANAVRLALLTGSRRGEVLGARWSEIDLEKGVWLKPATRTKQREASSIPLNDAALDLLR
jgi:integrase